MDDFRFEMLRAEDTDIIEQIEQHSEWLSGQLADKLRNGQICVVALDGRKMVGFNLINFGCVEIPLLETTRQFRPDAAWSEHIAVHTDYRGRGLGARLRYFIFGELKKRGYKRLYGGTLGTNLPSLKLARKVGFSEYADVIYTKILFHKTWQFKKVRE
jgi:GNAT superfamily N-acetyltransferase